MVLAEKSTTEKSGTIPLMEELVSLPLTAEKAVIKEPPIEKYCLDEDILHDEGVYSSGTVSPIGARVRRKPIGGFVESAQQRCRTTHILVWIV